MNEQKIKKCELVEKTFPPQHQDRMPGFEYLMNPRPKSEPREKGRNRLKGKVALITGGDSGIGRSIAYLYASEGADIVITYLYEEKDAQETAERIKDLGGKCLLCQGDFRTEKICKEAVKKAIEVFGHIDILVNNQAVQYQQEDFLNISEDQLRITFETNIYGYFFMTKAVLPYLKEGSSIINTTSITAYQGKEDLIDYSATKGAIVSFTRSLSQNLVSKKIRVNAVAPGPIWTPLTPATFPSDQVETFGSYTPKVPMERAGEPNEIAPCYLFLATNDASYMTGQVLHPNGGVIIYG